MKLKILLPTRILLEETVTKVTAPSPQGTFTLYPRHVDFCSSIAPGILRYREGAGSPESYVAVGTGILVKNGKTLLVSTRQGAIGGDLESLHELVRGEFLRLNRQERQMQTTLARLESSFVQRFVELDQP